MDRFDLEQQITKCWSIVDDLKDFDEAIFEGWTDFTEDNVSTSILGIANAYDIKFNKLWQLFELVHMKLVRENMMLNEECSALRQQLNEKNYSDVKAPKIQDAPCEGNFTKEEVQMAVITANKKRNKN